MDVMEFNLWKHHPVTKVFMQYLRDYAEVVKNAAVEDWMGGRMQLSTEQEMRTRLLMISEITEIELESIERFYAASEPDGQPVPSTDSD